MDGCYAFWRLGCVVDWTAWGAIGSMLAAIVAIVISAASARKAQAERSQMNSVILGQLYIEAKRIYWVSDWFNQLKEQIHTGRIPSGYDPALKLALRDVRALNTRVYDRFGQHVPSLPHAIAGVLIAQYSAIQTKLGVIGQVLDTSQSQTSLQFQFDRISDDVTTLRNSAFNIVGDLAGVLGYSDPSQRRPGPESYTTFAAYEKE
jgi:hypothetical protein